MLQWMTVFYNQRHQTSPTRWMTQPARHFTRNQKLQRRPVNRNTRHRCFSRFSASTSQISKNTFKCLWHHMRSISISGRQTISLLGKNMLYWAVHPLLGTRGGDQVTMATIHHESSQTNWFHDGLYTVWMVVWMGECNSKSKVIWDA